MPGFALHGFHAAIAATKARTNRMLSAALRPALYYAIFSVSWILLSDFALHYILRLNELTPVIEIIKGLVFVLVSALLIFVLTRSALNRQQDLTSHIDAIERELRDLAEHSNDLIFLYQFEPARGFTYVSPSCLRISGYSQDEFYADPAMGIKVIHPDDRLLLERLPEHGDKPVMLRWVRKDGSVYYMEQSLHIRRNTAGKVIAISGVARDVTGREKDSEQLKQLSDTLQLLWLINRTMSKRDSVDEIYRDACTIPLLKDDFALVWVGSIDRELNRIFPVARDGAAQEFLNGLEFTLNHSTAGNGPTGLCAREGKPIFIQDFQTDVSVLPWRDRAVAMGIMSVAAFPLIVDKEITATWTLYAKQPFYFDPARQDLFTRLAEDLSFALQAMKNRKTQESLHADLLEHEKRLYAIFNAAPIGVLIVDATTGIMTDVNPAFAQMLGYDPSELRQKTWQSLTPPEDITAQQKKIGELGVDEQSNVLIEKEYLHAKGHKVWARVNVTRLPEVYPGQATNLCVIEDITERKNNEEKMRMDSAVIRHTRDGVLITDLTPTIISVNRAFCEITGYEEAEVLGKNPNIVKSGRQDRLFYENLWHELTTTGQWQGEIYNRRKNGEIYPQLVSIDTIRGEDGAPRYYVSVFTDISRLKESEANFERLAHYDVLTGLPNRLMLTGRLNHALETALRKKNHVAVFFLDLDHFKNINDGLGHPAGDELLVQIAGKLRHRLREEDTVGRLGGDEFLILIEDIENPDGAAKIARDLLQIIAEPLQLSTGNEVYAAASIGISIFPEDGEDGQALIRNADAALYLAKSQGRSTFRFYNNSLTKRAQQRILLESGLRKAMENNEIQVFYQPLCHVETETVVGAEALVRWVKNDGTIISPAEFIPIAEDTGLIIPLGDYVMKAACLQAAKWNLKNRAFGTIAVNVSVRQLQQASWLQNLTDILRDCNLDPALLEIEITESGIMEKGAAGTGLLRQLRELGIRIAIDDFGTGYSSLSYLQRLPVSKLKIDQSFIRNIPGDSASAQIAKTIIAMAGNLKLHVLAEGVESREQLDFLRDQKCDDFQGYLVAKPLPASDFERLFL